MRDMIGSKRPFNCVYPQNQGCGVVVQTGVGIGRGPPFRLESKSELESINMADSDSGPSRRLTLDSSVDFGRTVMSPPKSIGRQGKGEWQCVNKIEALFSDKIPSDKWHHR